MRKFTKAYLRDQQELDGLRYFRDRSASINLQDVFRVALAEIKAAIEHPESIPNGQPVIDRIQDNINWVISQVELEQEGGRVSDPFLLPIFGEDNQNDIHSDNRILDNPADYHAGDLGGDHSS